MNYGTIKNFDIANGTGVRVSLFVSGCSHHCLGCFNAIAWDYNYGNEFTKEVENMLINMINNPNIEGLSLLGGEPFDPLNQKGLIEFLRRVKNECPGKNIWSWTGYTYERDLVPGGSAYTDVTDEMLSYLDILVDGKFVLAEKNINIRFRGSTNQRIIDMKKSLAEKKTILSEKLMNKETY